MDAENEMNAENVDVELFFRKPPEITNFELVKTIWIDPKGECFFIFFLNLVCKNAV